MSRRCLIVGLACAVILAGVFFGYRFYQSRQPAASLERLVAACQARDLDAFRRYVDVEAVAANAVDSLAAKALPGGAGGGNPVEQALSGLGASLAQAVKPELSRKLRASIESAVASGQLAQLRLGEAPPVGQAAPDGSNLFLGPVRRKDALALVNVTYLPAGAKVPMTPELLMEWRDDRWQVKAVGNLPELLGSLGLLLVP